MTNLAVKVVLSNGEDDELDLGTFNQGVAIDVNYLVDITNGNILAIFDRIDYHWHLTIDNSSNHIGYENIFIHGANQESENKEI